MESWSVLIYGTMAQTTSHSNRWDILIYGTTEWTRQATPTQLEFFYFIAEIISKKAHTLLTILEQHFQKLCSIC